MCQRDYVRENKSESVRVKFSERAWQRACQRAWQRLLQRASESDCQKLRVRVSLGQGGSHVKSVSTSVDSISKM